MTIGLHYISDAIKRDHRELEECHRRIVQSNDRNEQSRCQNQFIWHLACHSISKELVVCPIMEGHVKGGKALTEKDYEEHRRVTEALYRFQQLSPGDKEFMPSLEQLFESLKEHIKDEERKYLMVLEGGIDESQSQDLAKDFQRCKHFLSTRSHQATPHMPSFKSALGVLTQPTESLIKEFRDFPRE